VCVCFPSPGGGVVERGMMMREMMHVRRVKTLIATKCVFFGWSVAMILWFSLAGRITLKSVCGAKLWYHRYLPCAIEICRIWYYFRVQGSRPVPTYFHGTTTLQQQQLKKLGIIIYYLDKFNHNWSLHTPRAQGQTALQSEPLERGLLSFQDFHLGTYGCAAIQLLFSNIALSTRCGFVLLRCVDSYPLESTRLPRGLDCK
jgi:hypothetical protein